MNWTDGSYYKGEWVRGVQNGQGKMIYSDGTIKKGHFENNIYKGDEHQITEEAESTIITTSMLEPNQTERE